MSIYDLCEKTKKMEEMKVRTLGANTYFGEIALVHDSVRSATVTCSNYCTLGKIKLELLWDLCVSYKFFRSALMTSIHNYNDSSKVFLHTILRDIPYLKDSPKEIISAIAFSMKQDFLETGALLYLPGQSQECMFIIQDGTIELTTVMDNGTTVVLEKLSRGAILGAYSFLIADDNMITAQCSSPVQIFTIDRHRFTMIAQRDPDLLSKLGPLQD